MTEKFQGCENAREELKAVADWLGYQHEDLSYGLKSAEDGIKLCRYWRAHPELPEFCDAAESEDEGRLVRRHLKLALGYNPFVRALDAA